MRILEKIHLKDLANVDASTLAHLKNLSAQLESIESARAMFALIGHLSESVLKEKLSHFGLPDNLLEGIDANSLMGGLVSVDTLITRATQFGYPYSAVILGLMASEVDHAKLPYLDQVSGYISKVRL